jgi:hypothetical protein
MAAAALPRELRQSLADRRARAEPAEPGREVYQIEQCDLMRKLPFASPNWVECLRRIGRDEVSAGSHTHLLQSLTRSHCRPASLLWRSESWHTRRVGRRLAHRRLSLYESSHGFDCGKPSSTDANSFESKPLAHWQANAGADPTKERRRGRSAVPAKGWQHASRLGQ